MIVSPVLVRAFAIGAALAPSAAAPIPASRNVEMPTSSRPMTGVAAIADSLGIRDLLDIATVSVTVQQAIATDAYADLRSTGAFILIDEVTNQTVAAGMIRPGDSD